ncbi:MAG: hypothetical protein VBE63_19190 [Lamprobacter sp.]|uniref:hypothetical protein n=1 Tax=Lamprobacter sp. TaxID=3100796 RepID=UPI002B26273A|nr:hypothetical protein [Lamprobacter sp.]MEA3642042.1 hypothetical protein [Lamprobacter sp.]
MLLASTAVIAEGTGSGWQFRVTPYLWLPALEGNAGVNRSGLLLPDGSAVGPISLTASTSPDSYQVIDRSDFALDLMAGARYLTLDSDLKLSVQGPIGQLSRQNKVSLDQEAWDGIVGLRGQGNRIKILADTVRQPILLPG